MTIGPGVVHYARIKVLKTLDDGSIVTRPLRDPSCKCCPECYAYTVNARKHCPSCNHQFYGK